MRAVEGHRFSSGIELGKCSKTPQARLVAQ